MTEKPNALLKWAAAKTRKSPEVILRVVESDTLPQHGWPEFLPDELYELWGELSFDVRAIVFTYAHEAFVNFDPDSLLF